MLLGDNGLNFVHDPRLPTGFGVQVYLDSLGAGSSHDKRVVRFAAGCKKLAAAGVTWVATHSFTTAMTVAKFGNYACAADDAGLRVWSAYGLDSDDETGKAERIAPVAHHALCRGIITDLEGKGEDESAAAEAAHAREFRLALHGGEHDGVKYHGLAPQAPVLVQQWEIPSSHTRYPYNEYALMASAIAPMEYLNNWKPVYGTRRAVEMEKRWAKARAWIRRERYAAIGRAEPAQLPIFRTTHAVGWEDIPADRLAMLREHRACLLVWSEPFPNAAFLADIKRVCGEAPALPAKAPAAG